MSLEAIATKRQKLNREIEIAQDKLEQNIENISPSDYLPSINDILPNIISDHIDNKNKLGHRYNSNGLDGMKSIVHRIISRLINIFF